MSEPEDIGIPMSLFLVCFWVGLPVIAWLGVVFLIAKRVFT